MNIKSTIAITLLSALFAATAANAEGRAGGSSDYVNNTTTSVEFKKISVQAPAPVYVGTNR